MGREVGVKIKGTVVLMKKNLLDLTDFGASILDRFHELLGKGVCLQLISAFIADPENGNRGKLSPPAYVENWMTTITSMTAAEAEFKITFDWDEGNAPGAFLIKNFHHNELYLISLTLENVPGAGRVHFACNSWVYPDDHYNYDRVFFANKSYLPNQTPKPLLKYREMELENLRGNGKGELKHWDRVYDYDVYNDLGDPDNKKYDLVRHILGGSTEYPYPRRGRTGRPRTKTDPETEKRLFLLSLDIYVPRDERFNHVKMADFLAYGMKSLIQFIVPETKEIFDSTPFEFDTFEDVLELYGNGIKLPPDQRNKLIEYIPVELIKELVRSDGEQPLKFPMPQVIEKDKSAWMTDEEFGREMLAGVNPVCIRCLQKFPPESKLDPKEYGNQTSSITKEQLERNLDGQTVDEVLKKNKLFILDHHDTLMPYLNRINGTTTKTYATRTILYLQDDGTLRPLAIELSLPHAQGEKYGAVSKVFTPAKDGVANSVWQLAKAYASVNDSGVHQLISHWLNTHAVIEPFIIATNRQLSVLHPIYKLLQPHFRDTMNINALARQILINADGLVERTVFPSKYAMEMSAVVYKNWVFTEQGLPADLIKRGIAVADKSQPHGLRLLIEDYPYAVDGLEIWSAIETWVQDYCSFYYSTDRDVQKDTEVQLWWQEMRDVGHGDLKDEKWWPKMQTLADLTQTCTTMIWVASALHAAVNFGQYPYAGYLPNRPTISRRFMPEPGTQEYKELNENFPKSFMRTITSQVWTLVGVSLIEILSRHTSDEVYLGQRDTLDWTSDAEPLEAFKRFGEKLVEIENKIMEMNRSDRWKNRMGPVMVPYTLLSPNPPKIENKPVTGLTGKGIPNSVSI